jgi:phosphate transport system substrate-binding protein
MHPTRIIIFFLVLFFISCGSPDKVVKDRYDRGTIHISCDESFKPVIDEQVGVYESRNPGTKIIVHYKPEAECLKDYQYDTIRMVIATRGFEERERKFISDSFGTSTEQRTVAYDAIAVIVHPASADSTFTMAEIRDILGGKSNKNIIPVFDGVKATSTVRFMVDSVLRGVPLGNGVRAAESSEGVVDYVSKVPNAVGFLGVSWVGNREDTAQLSFLRKVRIAYLESTDNPGGFIQPYQFNLYTRRYPMVRDLVYVLKEKHLGLGHAFATFLRYQIGQLVFRRAYLYPAVYKYYVREAQLKE